MKYKILFKTILISLILSAHITGPAYAQSTLTSDSGAASMGIAQMVQSKLKNVNDGSIVSTSQHLAILSTVPYDPQVLGVVSKNAAIAINSSSNSPSNSIPVISSGEVYVLVSSQQGSIVSGDLITTSSIPGVGVKANNPGYVLGTALESYSNPNKKQTGLIVIDLNLHYSNSKPIFPGSLTDIFKYALLPTKDSPSAIYKYLVAAGVVVASLVLAFMSFGRTAAKGVEALGRNPAASKIIHLGIIFNVFIVVTMVAGGLLVAFLILRL